MLKTSFLLGFILIISFVTSSCSKEYAKFDDGEVIENSYSGFLEVTSTGSDPAGDFEGNGDSGIYSFAWDNPQKKASVNFDISTNTGSVQIILNDAKGDVVLNQTLLASGNEDSFSGVSTEGKEGRWLVTIRIENFNGDGSYSIHAGS